MNPWAGTHRSRSTNPLRSSLAVIAVAIGVLALPTTAAAGGIGISPVTLEFDDALRGATYTQSLNLTNTDPESGARFTIEATGEVADWVTTTLADGVPTESFFVPADSRLLVEVHLAVPGGVANRAYEGGLEVLGAVAEDSAGAGVQIGGLVLVNVDVTGTEVRAAEALDYRIANAEVGMDQLFTAIVRNDGNVHAIAELSVTIVRDGASVAELTSAGEMWVVQGGSSGPVEVSWPTAEERAGEYTAVFRVADVAGATPIEIGEREVAFRLEPIGTFTRSGTFDDLAVASEIGLDAPVVVAATFTNTGQIETDAVFEGRLYRDDTLVRVVQSLERAARRGETVVLNAGFEFDEPGSYQVEGTINYDGFITESRSLSIDVGPDGALSTPSIATERGGVFPLALALIGGALAFTAAIAIARWRRSAGHKKGDEGSAARRTPSAAEVGEPVDVLATSAPGQSWFDELDEREFDPDLMAAAFAELDAELGLPSGAPERPGAPD